MNIEQERAVGFREGYELADSRCKQQSAELLAFIKEWLADWTAPGPTDSPREAQARALIDRAEGK